MKYFLLLSIAFLSCNCVNTRYREYADNGQIKYDFKTNGDFGVTTDVIGEDKLRTGGIPLLSGNQSNDILTEAQETDADHQPSITVGDNFKVEGTLVHSYGMDVVGRHVVRGFAAGLKALVFWKGLDVIESTENMKTGSEVDKTNSNNNVKTNDSNNAVKINDSNNQKEIDLKSLDE